MAVEVSHGRGGAGNINEDKTQYVDGEVVRSGEVGSHGDGAYSSGRGGAGNISDIGRPSTPRKDKDVIPEAAYRASHDQDHHTGRGGVGNEHIAQSDQKKTTNLPTEDSAPIGLADKLKQKLFGVIKK